MTAKTESRLSVLICWRCDKQPMAWKVGPPLCRDCAVTVGICLECGEPKYDPCALPLRQGSRMTAAQNRIDLIAADVRKLRRRFASNGSAWTGAAIVDQLADHIVSLDCMLRASAADVYRDFFGECGDHDVAVEEALRETERRARHLRRLLGDGEKDELADAVGRAQREEQRRAAVRLASVLVSLDARRAA